LIVGEQDLESRKRIIAGLFALNRRAGALWAFAEEPNVGHMVGRSQELAEIFFDSVLPLRLGARERNASSASLMALDERSGILGDLVQKSFGPASDSPSSSPPTAWLPTERAARAWQALLKSEPFEH
jgi:hypothetical protein